MAQALSAQGDVQALRVTEAQPDKLADLDLLIVGSPTRAFRATPATYQFIKAIPANDLAGVKVAAFDTRMNVQETSVGILKFLAKLFGYAAEPIAKQLAKKGGELTAEPAWFYVTDSEGPLKDGELERAAAWALKVAAA
jgi:flavodoxin I